MAFFSARGLTNFISDIRNVQNKDEEMVRVEKELGKLRAKFTQKAALNSYDKKKYSWKLIYIYMLGYDIDFGHMQIINLLSSGKYSEKCLGYLGTSILLANSDEMMTLVINSVRSDLVSENASLQCLGLGCVANLGGNQLCESLYTEVLRLFESGKSLSHVRKKACLALSRIMQQLPELIEKEQIIERLAACMSASHLGIATAASGLLLTVASHAPEQYANLWEPCSILLEKLVSHEGCNPGYLYYTICCPWLQVTILKILQVLPVPIEKEMMQNTMDTVEKIIMQPEATKAAKHNALYAILFESMHFLIKHRVLFNANTKEFCLDKLGKFITLKESNIRYLSLQMLCCFVQTEGPSDRVKECSEDILRSLKDADNSIRQRSLDLLFALCDKNNALTIVNEMVNYLPLADQHIREEMVLKIAILAEKFADDLRWYVDTVIKLITISGSDVSNDIWHRVVQIVTNNAPLQEYTAKIMFDALESKVVDSTTLKFGSYILGEFGSLLRDNAETSDVRQFQVVSQHLSSASVETRCLMLTALVKMANNYASIRPQILAVLDKYRHNINMESQQRSCEYFTIQGTGDEMMHTILEAMPTFSKNRESNLVSRLKSKNDSEIGVAESPINTPEEEDTSACSNLISLDSPQKPVRAETIKQNDQTAPTLIGLTVQQAPQLKMWFNKLITEKQGILFEDDYLQIGVKHEYRGAQGKLSLFYGNKTDDEYSNLSCAIEQVEYLRIQSDTLPTSASGKQQLRQNLLIECIKPFADAVKLQLSFTVNNIPHMYPLRLPIVATSFVEAVPLNAADFIARWKALDGPDREQVSVFSVTNIDLNAVKFLLTTKLKFHLVEHVDASETSISLAGTFRTAAVVNGTKVSVGTLVRVEANLEAKAYRVTVRAIQADTSLAIKAIFVNILQF